MPSGRTHRLVVLGGERVGKTAIIEQLMYGNHVIGHGGLPTVGDIYEVTVETEKATNEKLQIFDTPGSLFSGPVGSSEQDHYLSVADGVVLVYDVSSKLSFDLVVSVRQKVAIRNNHVPMVAIGNKVDLGGVREVTTAKASQWARSHGVRPFEVTVLNRDCLREPFSYIAWRMGNPGKPFSVLPLLTSASLSFSNHTPITPHPSCAEATPPQDDTRLHSPDSFDGAAGGMSLDRYHDDSMYPSSKGTLFFADCLSSKSKAHFHNQD